MKIRLVPKKKPAPAAEKNVFCKGFRFSENDVLIEYDTGAEGTVKVCLFDALGHFIGETAEPRGTLCIPDGRPEGERAVYQLFVRLPDGSESIEEIVIS